MFEYLYYNNIGLDGVALVNNWWKNLERIYVYGASLIYYFNLNLTNWPANCTIFWCNIFGSKNRYI